MATDYDALLGVTPDASSEEIKRAYRQKARELHPDSTGGDADAERQFKEVSIAYETLSDPERRRRYDRFGPDEGAMGPGDLFGGAGFGDLFDAFFGAAGRPRGRRSGPVRGADAEVVVEIAFRDAVFGSSPDVAVELPTACADCGGSGARPGTSAMRCPDCDGTGELRRVRQSILGQVVTASPCPRCGGLGEAIASPCATCRGDGRRVEAQTYTVDVPAGVDHGSTLRLSGRGPAGPRGGPPGDLYVHLSVAPDPVFEREGTDLSAVLPVSFTQAALGAELPFATLDGEEKLAVPAGVQTGHVIRLRGRGVPHVRGRGRGDLHVQVVVTTPTDLSKSQEELLRRLAVERGEPVAQPAEGFVSRLKSAFGVSAPAGAPLGGPAAERAAAQVFVDDLEALELSAEDRRHLGQALRLRPDETVVAADGAGSWRLCAFTGSALRAEGEVRTAPRAMSPVEIAFVPAKGDRPEWVVQKLTELGCDRIVALRSARAVVRWDGERATRSLDRLRRVARAAAAQSRRAWLPVVDGVESLETWNAAAGALAQPGADALGPGDTAIAVGPEGGWAPEELAGRRVVGLGETILRSETAAMVAGALLCALRGRVVNP